MNGSEMSAFYSFMHINWYFAVPVAEFLPIVLALYYMLYAFVHPLC